MLLNNSFFKLKVFINSLFWDGGKTRNLAKFRGLFQNCPRKYIGLWKCRLHHPGFGHQIASVPDCIFRIDSI